MQSKQVMTVDDYCRARYSLPDGQKPTKAQRNSVTAMCQRGSIPAFKHGRRWFISWKED